MLWLQQICLAEVSHKDLNGVGQYDSLLDNGTLKGFDQTINLILDESHERVFSSSQGVEQVVLGLYIVRGDNVAVIGEIDEETDSALDLGNIRAEPLNSVVH
ncbi:LSM8 homolog, U6 small nuclear RNA associated isoform X2 [Malurus melanocephalus]|uniref:LSM8 homolog, U6 small nuclear RNA associated isoform X2 n=1 Tax=Malurus melanocephalus TaxID=175006 RepID=UPI002547222D|nr:LSM8 homolog, U6 small nuclear RNA associated isoform X2 [Malurus melanocephalus]